MGRRRLDQSSTAKTKRARQELAHQQGCVGLSFLRPFDRERGFDSPIAKGTLARKPERPASSVLLAASNSAIRGSPSAGMNAER